MVSGELVTRDATAHNDVMTHYSRLTTHYVDYSPPTISVTSSSSARS